MNLETSAKKALKERELLQVEIVKLNTEKLVNGLAMQLQNELNTMSQSIESLKSENESLKLELQKERENLKSFKEETYKAVNKDRSRLKKLENRSLWDWIMGR
jgi:regulator of replication initiation timing